MVILIIVAEGLKKLSFINSKYIIFYLIIISVLTNFLFFGISISTFFEAIISVSFAVLVYDIYKTIKIR